MTRTERPDGASQLGFTLTELLIVIAIITLLTTIAIPGYRSYVLKANRTAAKNVLMQVVARQENYFADNKRYTTDASKLGYGGASFYVDENGDESDASDSRYKISLSQSSNYDFTAKATAQNYQENDAECDELFVSNIGSRWAETDSNAASDCW